MGAAGVPTGPGPFSPAYTEHKRAFDATERWRASPAVCLPWGTDGQKLALAGGRQRDPLAQGLWDKHRPDPTGPMQLGEQWIKDRMGLL